MHRGFTRDYRKVEDWEWYKTPHMYHLFRHLIREANYKDGKWQGVEVKRGQLITGRKKLSFDTGIPEQSIRTCLDRLKSTNEITIKVTSKYSIITISNYDTYQFKEDEINQQNNQQLTNNQPASNQQLTTNKNDKNDKNIKEKYKKKKEFVICDKPSDIEQKLWDDFIDQRKRKDAPITQRALDAIRRESEIAKITLGKAIEIMLEHTTWTTFKASYIANSSNKPIPFTQKSKVDIEWEQDQEYRRKQKERLELIRQGLL